ncbi:MAG: ATP cone domain-containing protein [Candidatus Pacebacteria bacterium]|nr:ATP cone domain-containing protein [Candidatus Paceibacterota bacterium]
MSKPKRTARVIKTKDTDLIKKIEKRDGTIASFNLEKIANAIYKAMIASSEGSDLEASMVANKVFADLLKTSRRHKNFIPTVEGIQDTVEKELMLSDYVATAKNYIIYRQERAKIREQGVAVPEHVKKMATNSKKYFRNALGEFVYYRSYAKWIPEEERRETWVETVDRYVDFMKENLGKKLSAKEYSEVREAILKQEVMPSMRLMQFSGEAARKTNVCAYNCSFTAPESFEDIAEVMYISMCGTGCGWAVESRNIQKLPQIEMQTGKKEKAFVVPDSKEGWCQALIKGMNTWASGKDIDFDYSKIRPAGARLKTMGGKASGPDPLQRLLDFTREVMLSRQGRRLTNLNAHDILCMIGDCVVAGGVRRSAMISLSDLDDTDIRDAKKGQFYLTDPQRSLANNSAVYESKPSNTEFMEEWLALMKSGSGERGIFNRGALKNQLPERRLNQFKDGEDPQWGTNPCGEIILQSKQFCNLSEVVARSEDTEETLLKKIKYATILGTYQSSLTFFPFLSEGWNKNCEQERLLGVSITGQWDCPAVRDEKVLKKLRSESLKINKRYAKKIGVGESTCITCVKPSGTVSQMVDCASGMHPRHSQYYIRRVRISATDSLFRMLKDQGVPYHPEVGQSMASATTYVLDFPVKAPKGAIFKDDVSALEQLEHWKLVKVNYTEHNPSVTISVGEDEWVAVAHWLYENWDILGGLSFLPRDNHVYQLAPYEAIDEKKYNELSKRMQNIDFSKIVTYEKHDNTDVKKELACAGGTCEVI